MVGKSSLQEIATLAIIQEITDSDLETAKIWSLLDYTGELTALWYHSHDSWMYQYT